MALGLTPTTLSFIAGNGSPAPSAGVTDVLQNGSSVVDNGVARVTVPTTTSDLTNDSGFITDADIPAIPTKTSELQNDSGFITSADLPTVNDGTLTIQKNGTTIDTFTANSSSNKTVDISVPTKTSDLTNDSGFITSAQVPTYSSGNMVSINGQNQIGVNTTAGITDIQLVNSLPANPVATVLYLIPET